MSLDFSKIKIWITGLSIFGLQILMVFPLMLGLQTTGFSIVLRAFIFILSMHVLLNTIARKKFKVNGIGKVIIFFWVIYFFRLFYDVSIRDINDNSLAFAGKDSFIYQYALGASLIPLLAIIVNAQKIKTEVAHKLFYILSALNTASVLIILMKFTDIINMEAFSNRGSTSIIFDETGGFPINAITISVSGAILIIFSIYDILFKNGVVLFKRPLLNKICNLVTLFLGIVALFLGGSRGPFIDVILILILMLYFFFRSGRLDRRRNSSAIIFLIAIIVIPVLVSYLGNIGLINRLISTFDTKSDGEARYSMFLNAWEQFTSHPFLGDQFLEKSTLNYPHNILIEAFMATGIIGGLPFFIILLLFIQSAFKSFTSDKSIAIFFYVGSFYLLFSFTSGSIFLGPEMWLSLAFPLILNKNYI